MADNEVPTAGQIILYSTPDGVERIEVYYAGETFWLTQKRLAELFDVDVRTISEHLTNIFAEGELAEGATVRNLRIVRQEGERDVARSIAHYHLDAIIAVGYRVNSRRATQFRIWATQTLREFIVKGFVLDDERLKLQRRFGPDYFDELLQRIREIRASERRFYLKITDIFEQCSIDYDPRAEVTRTFFATVQNILHWAVTGRIPRRCPGLRLVASSGLRPRVRRGSQGNALGFGWLRPEALKGSPKGWCSAAGGRGAPARRL